MSHAVSATVTGPRRLVRRGTGLSSHRHYLSCPLSRSLSFALALSLPLPRSSPWPLSASGCSCAGAEGCGAAGVTGGAATGVCTAGGQSPLSFPLLSLSRLAFTFSFPCPLPLLCCGGAGSGVGVAGVGAAGAAASSRVSGGVAGVGAGVGVGVGVALALASASALALGEEWERASASHRASSVLRSQDEASGPSPHRDSRRVDRGSSLRVTGHLRAARRPWAVTTARREPHARSAEVKTAAQSAIARLHAVRRTAPAWPLRRRWLLSTARRLGRARFFPSCFSPRLSIPRSRDVSAPGV